MSKLVSLTSNVTNEPVFSTGYDKTGISVIVPAAATFGGGTLTLKVRPARSGATPETIDTLTAGLQAQYVIGSDMEVLVNLSGATSPSIDLMLSQTA